MTKLPSYFVTISLIVAVVVIFLVIPLSHALNDASAIVYGIMVGKLIECIECYLHRMIITVPPHISFLPIFCRRRYFCRLRSCNYGLLIWDSMPSNDIFRSKQLYNNHTVLLENPSIADTQIWATLMDNGKVKCWSTNKPFESPLVSSQFVSISCWSRFSCGSLRNSSQVQCWGRLTIANQIQDELGNICMWSLATGDSRVCGLNSIGFFGL